MGTGVVNTGWYGNEPMELSTVDLRRLGGRAWRSVRRCWASWRFWILRDYGMLRACGNSPVRSISKAVRMRLMRGVYVDRRMG